jgi:hypothetical protein
MALIPYMLSTHTRWYSIQWYVNHVSTFPGLGHVADAAVAQLNRTMWGWARRDLGLHIKRTEEEKLAKYIEETLFGDTSSTWRASVSIHEHTERKAKILQRSTNSTSLSMTLFLHDAEQLGALLELQFRHSQAISLFSSVQVSKLNMQHCNLDVKGARDAFSQLSVSSNYVVHDGSYARPSRENSKQAVIAKRVALVCQCLPTLPPAVKQLDGFCGLVIEQALKSRSFSTRHDRE